MKKILPLLIAGSLASCASNSQLFEVTHIIAEHDSTIDVWSSHAFIRTDIQITRDSIHFFQACGEFNKMIKTESIDFTHVLDVTDSTLVIQQPDQVTTYMLFNLQNHYE